MVMSITPLVSKPPTSLWWSMIATTSSALTLAGSSAGLLVSTITALVPSAISVTMRGLGHSQYFTTKFASVFGSPNSTASALVAFTSFRYQAQMMGDPVESVSGDLWPKTSVVMELPMGCDLARLIGAGAGFVTGGGAG